MCTRIVFVELKALVFQYSVLYKAPLLPLLVLLSVVVNSPFLTTHLMCGLA